MASCGTKVETTMESILTSISRRLEGGVLSGVPALHDPLARFFVQAVFIIVICRGLCIFSYVLKQPNVVFEIIGGIMLGPSAIGRNEYYLLKMFPTKSLKNLGLVANIGLVLYLFLVGLELDPKLIKSHLKSAAGISLCGIALPFALGIAISRVMFDTLLLDDPDPKLQKNFTSFFVFIGTAMSITAFPVLARILKEGGLIYTKPGAMAMGAAAIDDAVAWCLLTLAISIANAKDMHTAAWTFLSTLAFALGLFIIIRPIFEKLVDYVERRNDKQLNSHLFAFTICLVFMSAWVTYIVGVHFIFGAFLFGLIVPRGSHLFTSCIENIEQLVLTFTLPLYFALSGLKTDVTTLRTGDEGAMLILVIFIACAGKFVGCGGAALLGGMGVRESAVIATLMNTRGLVELIVLNLGLDAHILNIRTFSVMVIMALFTTFITTPIIEIIYPHHMRIKATTGHSPKESSNGNDENDGDLNEEDNNRIMDIKKSSKETRFGLIVDCVQHLQSLITLMNYLAPHAIGSEMSITVVHFIEPTKSNKDEFLALNDQGRLIRVDEETTDIVQAIRDMDDPSVKKPELLPLTMFCKGIESQVNAFRIQGDPNEFSHELKTILKQNDCSMTVVPWRSNSDYFQKLFWSSVHTLSIPLALLITINHEVDTRSSQGGDGSSNKVRGDSHDGGNNTTALYSNVESSVVPSHRRMSITKQMHKMSTTMYTPHEIVGLVTGKPLDLNMFALLLRFAERPTNRIHVLVPQDETTFDTLSRSALALFRKEVNDMINVAIVTIDAISTDIEQLHKDVTRIDFDLFVSSFIEPVAAGEEGKQGGNSRQRSGSFAGAIADAIAPTTDVESFRLNLGVPAHFASSTLTYPELGLLGSKIYEATSFTKAKQMVILHESHKMHFTRRGTLNNEKEASAPTIAVATEVNNGNNNNGRGEYSMVEIEMI